MSANIGISNDNQKKVIELMNLFLANEYALYLKTQKYHWNVVSPSYTEITGLFFQQSQEIGTIIENTAMRIRQLDGEVTASFTEYSKMLVVKEETGTTPADTKMIKNLLDDHESACSRLLEGVQVLEDNYRDYATALMLKTTIAEHEKLAAQLRSYLK